MGPICTPKALKRYCAFKTKCHAKPMPTSWFCKKGKRLVVRIPKKPLFAKKNCLKIRAKIRKGCK